MPLDHIEVQVAVAVVIEQGAASAHHLTVVELARHPVEVDEVKARLFRFVGENPVCAASGPGESGEDSGVYEQDQKNELQSRPPQSWTQDFASPADSMETLRV